MLPDNTKNTNLYICCLSIAEEEDTSPVVPPAVTPQRPDLTSLAVKVIRSDLSQESRLRPQSTPGESTTHEKGDTQRPPTLPLGGSLHAELTVALSGGEGRAPEKGRSSVGEGRNMDDVMEGEDKGIRHSNRLEKLLRQQMCIKSGGNHSNQTDATYKGSTDRLHKTFCDGFKPLSDSAALGSKYSIASSEQELGKYLDGADGHQSLDYTSHGPVVTSGSLGRSRSVGSLNHVNNDPTYSNHGKQGQGDGTSERDTRYPSDYNHNHTRNGITSSTPTTSHKKPHTDSQPSQHTGYHSDDYITSNRSTPNLSSVHPGSAEYRREAGYMESGEQTSSSGTHQPSIRSPLITTRTTISSRGPGADREVSTLHSNRGPGADREVSTLEGSVWCDEIPVPAQ